jgi:hypothetical protein
MSTNGRWEVKKIDSYPVGFDQCDKAPPGY